MTYRTNCPHCGVEVELRREHLGILLDCLACQQSFKYDEPLKQEKAAAKERLELAKAAERERIRLQKQEQKDRQAKEILALPPPQAVEVFPVPSQQVGHASRPNGFRIGVGIGIGIIVAFIITTLIITGIVISNISPTPVAPQPVARLSSAIPTTLPESKTKRKIKTTPIQVDGIQGVEINVVKAHIGKVDVLRFGETVSSQSVEDQLIIKLSIKNTTKTKKMDYQSWHESASIFGSFATLTDNLGNSYKRITFGLTNKPYGRTEQESIHPGQQTADVLVFEVPIEAAEILKLRLPGKNLGLEGITEIEIPTAGLRN